MNTENNYDNTIGQILRDANNEISPPDSWEALRGRIDQRITNKATITLRSMIFWRRTAIGMAACLLITLGILSYSFVNNHGIRINDPQAVAVSNNLLNQTELNRLSLTFSQVRQLFQENSQWIMVGSGTDTQMGITDKSASEIDNKVIVIRLAVNLDSGKSKLQYFDVVMFPNQQANLQLPLANTHVINVSLKPIIRNDGMIEAAINARADGTSEVKSVGTMVDNSFTSLVRMRVNGGWVYIDGTGQSMQTVKGG
jgi:hypothetical protein